MAGPTWKPPYLSYETLTNFLEKKLAAGSVPPRIDSQFLDNYAGSVRPLLIAALKTTGMIDDRYVVQDRLHEAVSNPEDRKRVLREWASDFYSEQIGLAQRNATASMLWETFSKHQVSGSTLRKAVVFYLALTEDLGLPSSPHFRPPKAQQPVAGRTGRAQRTPRGSTSTKPDQASAKVSDEPPRHGMETVAVTFGSAGTVEIAVEVRWLELPDETFVALRKAIRDIQALGFEEAVPPDAGVATNGQTGGSDLT